MSEEKLKDFLRDGKDWSRMRTNIPGVFIQKLPAYRSSPDRLAVEVNPADSAGNPTKKRGVMIRSGEELEAFRGIFQDEKLTKLQGLLDSINPKTKAVTSSRGEDVLEI